MREKPKAQNISEAKRKAHPMVENCQQRSRRIKGLGSYYWPPRHLCGRVCRRIARPMAKHGMESEREILSF